MTKTHDMKQFSLFAGFFLLSAAIWANNIRVTNATLMGQNPANNTYQIKFDLAWDNSWRTSTFENNWDAAWVFIKYRERTSAVWSHAEISLTGFVTASGATINVSPDNMGAMIYRSANGIGNISYGNLELQWDYGNAIADDDRIELSVIAIEMVYVPQGSFYVGDGGTLGGSQLSQGTTTNPLQITSENSLGLGDYSVTSMGSRNSNYDDFNNTPVQIFLPAAFPKGFNAFYCMKYECSMGQYVDFLNKLTIEHAEKNFIYPNGRYGFTITNAGIYATTTPDRACNFMRWRNATAYADWAGLRPMTELEYEKACRGPETPVPDEFAFGSTSNCILNPTNLQNSGTLTEFISNLCTGSGNANTRSLILDPNISRPLRSGIYAASAINKTREETGATYYGIMEMSGNLFEMCVGVGSSSMTTFTGRHGDGSLNSTGRANILFLNNFEYTKRGGTFYNSNTNDYEARTSARTPVFDDGNSFSINLNGVYSNPLNQEEGQGIRLARSDF